MTPPDIPRRRPERPPKQTPPTAPPTQQQLQLAEQWAGLGHFDWDIASDRMVWSDGLFRLLGLEPGMHAPGPAALAQALHPEDRARHESALHAALHAQAPYDCSFRASWPDGSLHPLRGRGDVTWDGAGRAVRMLGMLQDVSESEALRHEVAIRQKTMATLRGSVPLALWFLDAAGITTDVNPALCALLGHPREILLGRSMLAFAAPDSVAALRQTLEDAAAGRPANMELVLMRGDGAVVRCLSNAIAVAGTRDERSAVLCMISDLSTLRHAREALGAAEFVVNSVRDLVSVIDLEGLYRMVNDAWCRRTGLARESVIGRRCTDVLPQVASIERMAALDACIQQRKPQVLLAAVTLPGATHRTMETTMTPYLSPSDRVLGVVSVTRDVTQQEDARAAVGNTMENLRRILNATNDGMVAYDATDVAQADGSFLFVNDRAYELWGVAPQTPLEGGPYALLTAVRDQFVDLEAEEQRIAAIVAMDVPHEDRLVLRDGRILLRRSVPLKGNSGPARVWSFRDVTLEEGALAALRASDAQQRALMDAFPGYVAVVDEHYVYVYMNAPLAEALGKTVQEVIGHSLREVLGEPRAAELMQILARVSQGEKLVTERSFPAALGRPRLDTQVTYVTSPGTEHVGKLHYAFGVDITDRKRAEAAHLLAREEAERANQGKSAFLASVSHELRTPLNAILGFSQLLRDGSQLPLETTDTAAAEIQRAGQHLMALVDDLIDLGQVEAGRLELAMTRVATEAVINESLSMVAPLAAQRGIRIVFTGGAARNAMVHADAMRLRQVLINLLSNAVKYNRDDGSVRVHCGWRGDLGDPAVSGDHGDHGGPFVRITVQDTGIGISPSVAKRMFSAFDRLGAERGVVQGTGIGLVISQRLVHAMGGSIGYESKLDQGSSFWVDLAQASPLPGKLARPAAAGPRRLPLAAHQGVPRVLVAEDYAPNQAVLRLQLRSLGCEVEVAGDGVQALARWQDRPCDLILTDLDMPRMDGLEFARAVRRLEARGKVRVPIVAISAAVIGDERARCLEAGISDLLVKPVSIDDLAAVLARWLDLGEGDVPPASLPATPASKAQVANPAQGTEPAVLDLEYLYHVLGRVSTTQALGLLATFVRATRAGLAALSVPGTTSEDWRREMHRQRSSARTVGAMAYAAQVVALEQLLRFEGAPTDRTPWVLRLEGAMAQVEAAQARMEDLPPESLPAPLRAEPGAAPLCQSVLVVDDDPVVLMHMAQMLTEIGVAEVLCAHNGLDAIELMGKRSQPVEVVVCDLNMPRMDGVEMIRRFGQSGFAGGLILMSGAGEQLLATVGRLAGLQGLAVLGHIQKPATPGAMRVLLRKGSSAPVERLPVHSGLPMTPESIRAGIQHQEFTVWFQPKVHAITLAPLGVEALARWRQADGSYVPPDLFIVMAERAGIIDELSGVLLATALHEGARLHAAGYPLSVSINLSALWLNDLDLPDLMLRSVVAVGLTPADIVLEVTETGLTKDLATALDVLSRLRLKGFGLSIDDFGIGYSSFEQLGRIPFTEMKLDRSFVNRGVRDAAALAILESSMAMAHRLELSTVAEGVETERELQLMRTLGCDSVQGYLIAKPMPADKLIRWLRERAPGGAPA